MATVVIGDDNRLLSELLAATLPAHGYEVVGAAGSAPDFLAALERVRPDVGLVNARALAGADYEGRFLRTVAAAAHPPIRIVLVVAEDGSGDGHGADGVVDKRASLQALVDELDRVLCDHASRPAAG